MATIQPQTHIVKCKEYIIQCDRWKPNKLICLIFWRSPVIEIIYSEDDTKEKRNSFSVVCYVFTDCAATEHKIELQSVGP
jgi:hypothetical protein